MLMDLVCARSLNIELGQCFDGSEGAMELVGARFYKTPGVQMAGSHHGHEAVIQKA